MSVSMKIDKIITEKKSPVAQRSFLDWIGSFGAEDIGVDFGTSNIVIYVKNKGLVFPEASVVAKYKKTDQMFTYGIKAEEMEGRAPREIEIIRPMETGAIVDYPSAAYLLNSVVNQSYLKGMFFHPRLLMCVPRGISRVQRRALLEASVAIGARKPVLIEKPLAAVMGLGVKTNTMKGMLIADIGGGAAKAAIVSKYGIVRSSFSNAAGLKMDEAIVNVIMDKYHVRISRKSGETLKIALGIEWDLNKTSKVHEVSGISAMTGLPVKIAVTAEDIAQGLNPILYEIFSQVTEVIQQAPPDILENIRENGIVLTGGIAQMKGLAGVMETVTDMPVHVADHPSYVNAVGAGSALEYMDYFRDSLQDLH